MAALAQAAQARKRGRLTSMDDLPVEVIGMILSRVECARHIARASATCRKWREAAEHHLHSLSFEEYEHTKGGTTSTDWEIRITETLMRTSCLQKLTIRMESTSERTFHAAPVIAWLLHSKKTLKSLTFTHPIEPSVNILEKLGGSASKLEHLEWRSGCINTIDPIVHRLDSLISLTLFGMQSALAVSNFMSILSVCPKLESLVLVDTHIMWDIGSKQPYPTLEITSTGLKNLFINGGFDAIKCMILHTNSLERLYLKEVAFWLLKVVQEDGHGGLQRLSITEASILQLDIGDSVSSLHKLRLNGIKDFGAEWAKFYPLFARASNLRKLSLSDCIPDGYKFDIGLHNVALSFPHLCTLELNYQHARNAFASSTSSFVDLPTFGRVIVLKVCTPKFHEQFTRWLVDFLRQCPRLERVRVSGGVTSGTRDAINERMAKFTACMIQVARSYPDIDMEFFFI